MLVLGRFLWSKANVALSSLCGRADPCHRAAGGEVPWINRVWCCWTEQLNASRCSEGWYSWTNVLICSYFLVNFCSTTSELWLSWAFGEWKLLKKAQACSKIPLLGMLDVNVKVFHLSRFSLCNWVRWKRKNVSKRCAHQ